MDSEFLFGLNPWALLAALLLVLALSFEAGFRLGRRSRVGKEGAGTAQITTMQSAMLGMLALLLGFTFSMSLTRFDARKQLVRDEANAIGTTWLRTRMLPQPQRDQVADLLREYVDLRLALYEHGLDRRTFRELLGQAGRVQEQLWAHAVVLGESDPRSVQRGLFVQSLNEMIDLHESRYAAMENHVPESILLLLIIVAAFSLNLTGYNSGITGHRYLVPTAVMTFLICGTIVMVADLDNGRQGLIRVSQNSLIRLRDSMPRR